MTSGPFEQFYSSFWQHPVLLWVATLPFTIYFFIRGIQRTQSRFLKGYFAVFSVSPLLDAWLTANHVFGIGALPAALGTGFALFFVILGDYRYFLLMDGLRPSREKGWRRWMPAVGWSLIVPILTPLIMRVLPPEWRSPRVLFLVYESSFLVLALSWLFLVLPPREKEYGPRLSFATRQMTFWVVAYYATWVVADVLVLARAGDFAYVVRAFANLQYYAGFAPWAFLQLSQKGKTS
jgi:hypothetical protein